MKLTNTARSIACLWICAMAAFANAAKPSGIYERATEEGSVELSNLTTEEDAQLVVEGAGTEAQGTTPATAEERGVVRSRASVDDSVPPSAETAPGTTNAVAERSASSAPTVGSSGGGFGSASLGVSPMTSLSSGDAGATAALPSASVGAGAGAGGSPAAAPGTVNTGGPSTLPPSILDNPSALEARAQQYREMMLHAPLEANGKPANPAIVRRYLATTRSAYQGGR